MNELILLLLQHGHVLSPLESAIVEHYANKYECRYALDVFNFETSKTIISKTAISFTINHKTDSVKFVINLTHKVGQRLTIKTWASIQTKYNTVLARKGEISETLNRFETVIASSAFAEYDNDQYFQDFIQLVDSWHLDYFDNRFTRHKDLE